MVGCNEMKTGQVYVCGECGIELKVVKECTECGTSSTSCGCEEEACSFECCGEPMLKKE